MSIQIEDISLLQEQQRVPIVRSSSTSTSMRRVFISILKSGLQLFGTMMSLVGANILTVKLDPLMINGNSTMC